MLRNFVDFDQPCGKILQLLITQALEIWQPVLFFFCIMYMYTHVHYIIREM